MTADDRLRVFCLPYAGGSSILYETWRRRAPAQLEICPVELPGRGRRLRERALTSIDELAADVTSTIAGRARPPFALFGHSLGATIAFESARLLRSHGCEPDALVVSAQRAPHLPAPSAPIHGLDDEAFLDEILELGGTDAELLEHGEMLTLFLPVLRADFIAAETYHFEPGAPLRCPIHAFGGSGDREIPPVLVRGWSMQTEGGFHLRMLPGGHFYIHDFGDELMAAIAAIPTRSAPRARELALRTTR